MPTDWHKVVFGDKPVRRRPVLVGNGDDSAAARARGARAQNGGPSLSQTDDKGEDEPSQANNDRQRIPSHAIPRGEGSPDGSADRPGMSADGQPAGPGGSARLGANDAPQDDGAAPAQARLLGTDRTWGVTAVDDADASGEADPSAASDTVPDGRASPIGWGVASAIGDEGGPADEARSVAGVPEADGAGGRTQNGERGRIAAGGPELDGGDDSGRTDEQEHPSHSPPAWPQMRMGEGPHTDETGGAAPVALTISNSADARRQARDVDASAGQSDVGSVANGVANGPEPQHSASTNGGVDIRPEGRAHGPRTSRRGLRNAKAHRAMVAEFARLFEPAQARSRDPSTDRDEDGAPYDGGADARHHADRATGDVWADEDRPFSSVVPEPAVPEASALREDHAGSGSADDQGDDQLIVALGTELAEHRASEVLFVLRAVMCIGRLEHVAASGDRLTLTITWAEKNVLYAKRNLKPPDTVLTLTADALQTADHAVKSRVEGWSLYYGAERGEWLSEQLATYPLRERTRAWRNAVIGEMCRSAFPDERPAGDAD